MSSLDGVIVVVAVSGATATALVGWLLGATRDQTVVQMSERVRIPVTAVIAVGSVAAFVQAPVIAPFWMLVALNFVLGPRENVPFSTFGMFSEPPTTAWALRFEDEAGGLIPIRHMGISPHTQKKRFDTEVRAAREQGIADLDDARRRAAEVLAVELEEHRRPDGKWAKAPITIALVEYYLESGKLVTVRTTLMETRPG